MRTLLRAAFLGALAVGIGCGSSEEEGGTPPATSTGGSAGKGGSGGKAGAAGQAGSAGTGGAGAGGAQAGSAGAGQAGAGQAGASGAPAGNGGAGSGGASAGQAGAGSGGAGGAGAGGAGGGGQAGLGGEGGSAGAGSGGAGQGGGGAAACPADCTGLCVNGQCCDALRACGDVCCGAGDVCSFQKCVAPGKECSAGDCEDDEYCEPRLGGEQPSTCGGDPTITGKCLPKPPVCPGGEPPDPSKPLSCVGECQVKPAVSAFDPELKYYWGGETGSPYSTDVMMTPIVIQLDDDDCDGKVTERDIPEIVFTTFSNGDYGKNGTLHAISIVGGKIVDKWQVAGVLFPSTELAGGNIDGEPGNEVVGCGVDGHIYAFKGDGTQLWKSAEPFGCYMISIADLDQDGQPEVVLQSGVVDGKTGATRFKYAASGDISVSDIDGDGKLDIVSIGWAIAADGSTIVDTKLQDIDKSSLMWSAVGDLDKDGTPEVVGVNWQNHQLHVWRHDPTLPGQFRIIRQSININDTISTATFCGSNYEYGGGPPTIADFDGDGFPDVGVASAVGHTVLSGKKLMDPAIENKDTLLWLKQTQDCSSAATGTSLFDFNGDGKAEVLYADELRFRIFDGPTGDVLFSTCNTTGTLIENPVVADVDNDGQADIVVASNAYAFSCDGTKQSGVRVFGSKSKSWVKTRRVWNQHAYHITNVDEDGSIPKVEKANWLQPGLNNFRTNKQPGNEFGAPDVVVSLVVPRCEGPFGLVATVRNIGQAVLPAGVQIGFYKGTPQQPTLLGFGTTKQALFPAQAEDVELPFPGGLPDVQSGQVGIFAIADDDAPAHDWVECRTDNNTSVVSQLSCGK